MDSISSDRQKKTMPRTLDTAKRITKKLQNRPASGSNVLPSKSNMLNHRVPTESQITSRPSRNCDLSPPNRIQGSKKEIVKEENQRTPNTAVTKRPVQKHNNFMEPALLSKKSSPKIIEKPQAGADPHKKNDLDRIYLSKNTRKLLSLAAKKKTETSPGVPKKPKPDPAIKPSDKTTIKSLQAKERLTRSKSPLNRTSPHITTEKAYKFGFKKQRLRSSDAIKDQDYLISEGDINMNKFSAFGGKSQLVAPEELVVIHDIIEDEKHEEEEYEENIQEEFSSEENDEIIPFAHKGQIDNIFSNFSYTSSLNGFANKHPHNFKTDIEPVEEENRKSIQQSLEFRHSQDNGNSEGRFNFLDKTLEHSFLDAIHQHGMVSPTFQRDIKDSKAFSINSEIEKVERKSEERAIDLIFDGVLDCYYDPKTETYYNLKI